jgi:Reverse transcriptase (RNA-dependent DNA polymerase)
MSQIIELGIFSPDIGEAVRQLKHDLKDDWYPDSLGYEDALRPDVLGDFFKTSFEQNHGLYVPEGRTELDIPKKGFVCRYALEMSLPDRLYYQALVGHLIPFYDPLLPNEVLNHRYAVTGHRATRYLFKHSVEQWQHFCGYVAEEARTKSVVLITDVQNFYENIQIEAVIGVLENKLPHVSADGVEKSRIRRIIAELRRCLSVWCYRQTHGLPQNRDASAFLASLVMLPVDSAMLTQGYSYYRYMDDIRVAVNTKYQAREALLILTTELRRLGLNVNPAKTKIWEPSEDGYDEALRKSDPMLSQIDSMWRSRFLPVIRRSFAPLQLLAEDLIKRGATQERAFRFCVNKFEKLALCAELAVPKTYFDPMTDACIQELDSQPFSSDKFVSYLKAVPTSDEQISKVAILLKNSERAIYDWQNYLLWQLLVFKRHNDPDLLPAARKRIESSERPADRAGATLYLGAVGSSADREFVSRSFQAFNPHILQRNALIAIHEIEFHAGIKRHVADHVMPSLKGTYRRLRDGFRGQYYRPLAAISAIDLYDEVSSYD